MSRQFFSPPELDTIHEAVQELIDRLPLTEGDCIRARDNCIESIGDQYLRRVAVRTIIASLEAEVAVFKRLSLEARKVFGRALSEKEERALQPNSRMTTHEKFRTALVSLAGSLSEPIEVSIPPNEMADLRCAIELRHRVVHPRKASDLAISDQEFVGFMRATDWYRNKMMLQVFAAFTKQYTSLRSASKTFRRQNPKARANDLCSCGSGLKHKRCHGRVV